MSPFSEGIFDLDSRKATVRDLEKDRIQPGYWDDQEAALQVERRLNSEKSWIESWEELQEKVETVAALFDLLDETPDPDLEAECEAEIAALVDRLDSLELRNMMRDEDDKRNAILTINPGAGGTESQDWSEMLVRMYTRWGENHDYKVSLLGIQEGDVAGIKSATLRFEGDYAFGYLKSESGVHRLVRISPFDSSGRRHTSFASVFVYPEIDNTIDIQINPDEVELQRFHSGGKGGQNVNKVESGVRLIWEGKLSDGSEERVTAECTEERSQLQNRERAMQLLKSRVYQLERDIREAARNEMEKSKKKIEWGSQIRSYVFQPYTMVNDHRTEQKEGDVQSVINGELDPFIKAFLMQQQ